MTDAFSMKNQELSPLMRQYWAIKAQHPEAILFFRVGDFFEMFFDLSKCFNESIFFLTYSFPYFERMIPFDSFFIIPLLIYSYNNKLLYYNINDRVIAYLFYIVLGIIPFVVIVSFILYRMFLPLLSAMLPRLLMAIASAWIFFATTEELIKSSFDVQILDIHKIWVFLLLIPVVAFMAVEINNMAPDIAARTLIKRMSALIGVGFIYSLLIGLFFINFLAPTILIRSNYLSEFYSSEVDSLEVKGSNKLFYKVDLSTSAPTLSDIQAESNVHDKEKYQYLDFVKYNSSWLSLDSFRLRYEIPVYKEALSFEIFPGMLIYRAIFALFIGIFIQLIFEDKPITEPL